jgi:hypothetical protein
MPSSTRRCALRVGTVLVAASAVTLVGAAPAFAHVTTQPGTAEQGSYAVIALRVPTESDTSDPTARRLGGGGLLVGPLGLGVGVGVGVGAGAVLRSRRTAGVTR